MTVVRTQHLMVQNMKYSVSINLTSLLTFQSILWNALHNVNSYMKKKVYIKKKTPQNRIQLLYKYFKKRISI